jgi:hypothetical protein
MGGSPIDSVTLGAVLEAVLDLIDKGIQSVLGFVTLRGLITEQNRGRKIASCLVST